MVAILVVLIGQGHILIESVTLIGFDHLDRSLCLTLWLYCMPSFLRGYIVRSISIVSKGVGWLRRGLVPFVVPAVVRSVEVFTFYP